MAHTEQTQLGCNRCGEPTLHTCVIRPMNHTPHLIVSLLLCGFWLPVWILLAMVHNPRSDPWRCSRCGQAAGTHTPEQEWELAVCRAEENVQQSIHDAERLAIRAEQRFTRVKRRAARRHRRRNSLSLFVKSVPGRVDFALRKIAGEENDIIYHFLRVSIVVAGAASIFGVAYLLTLVISKALT